MNMPVKTKIAHFLLIVVGAVLAGCSQQPVVEHHEPVISENKFIKPCDELSTMNLSEAFLESKTNLSRRECNQSFERNFELLKSISKGDPKPENRVLFASWLNWANQRGIISVKRSKDYFNRYFNTTFISLPTHGNICAHMAREPLIDRLDAELKQKSEGYNEILADKAGYNQAYSQYIDMSLMLQSLRVACDIGGKDTHQG